MNYNEAIDFIMSHRKFQKTGGYERIEKLLSLLGSPHKKLRFVHIVGTNGKGSTSTAMAYVLKEAGYKAGLFTSPYVVKFGERIQVNGEYIPEKEIAEICELIKEKISLFQSEDMYPTVFEVTTALAMVYFEKMKCDIVFLEAGIGGLHDSTNIIPSPLACVFTAISLDHTEMLGDTTEKIAREKCGIIKEGTSVVSFPADSGEIDFIVQDKAAEAVIRETAEKKGCPCIFPDCSKVEVSQDSVNGLNFSYENIEIRTKMTGTFQIGNIITAIETLKILREKGFSIKDEAIEVGIKNFTIPARTEVVSNEPLVIIDGGHNEASVASLCRTLRQYLSNRKITLLLSFMKDKDYETCLKLFSDVAENAVFTNVDPQRGESSEILSIKAKGLFGNVQYDDSVDEAYRKALSLVDEDGALVVAGSFYLAAYIRGFK